MSVIKNKINNILKEKNLSYYQLSKLTDFDESALNKMLKGKISLSPKLLERIVPILEISPETIKGWILADKYPKDTLKKALNAKQEKQENEKLIFTAKIDEILQHKDISRTALSKMIKYSQGSLNERINGKYPMSPAVMAKIAPILEVSTDDLIAWAIADKYSLEALQAALER